MSKSMIDKEVKRKEDCVGCYGCENICPAECIIMAKDSEGFTYPKVNYDECIKCGKCIEVCPGINRKSVKNDLEAYACINKDETTRLQSSSGGIFTILAEKVIREQGVVFGAAFDEEFELKHCYVETQESIGKLRGSKYLQSQMGDTYKQAMIFLDLGRNVLFSGTPCQIGGLKSYLGKSYGNLLCVDIICHGVPSPDVWEKYKKFREKAAGSSAKSVSFRLKNEGWKRFSMAFLFENRTDYRKNLENDLYMKTFLKDICLRPSCYECKFKTLNRQSDITLADFWGIENIIPELDDDKGTSLIFVNSVLGNGVFKSINECIECAKVDINEAVSYNLAAIKSAELNLKRESFFKDLPEMEFDQLVKEYCTDKLSIRLKRKIKYLLRVVLEKLGILDWTKRTIRK
jgi:coenzyme F420-reducing hydrogenase beta subunit